MTDMNPCPFCDCSSTRTERIIEDETWYVVCEICEAIGPIELSLTLAQLAWNKGTSRWRSKNNKTMTEQEIREAITELRMLWGDIEWWEEQDLPEVRQTLKAALDAAEQLRTERDDWVRKALGLDTN
jgi:hypothetical protein